MAALVETMFSVREKPWHGLGTIVSEAPDSQKALELAGLDWNVIQKDIITSDEICWLFSKAAGSFITTG